MADGVVRVLLAGSNPFVKRDGASTSDVEGVDWQAVVRRWLVAGVAQLLTGQVVILRCMGWCI